MKIVSYGKPVEGPVVVSVIDTEEEIQIPKSVLRCRRLLKASSVDKKGELVTLNVDELFEIFMDAVKGTIDYKKSLNKRDLERHRSSWKITRWFKEFFLDWCPTYVPREDQVVNEMINECFGFSEWLDGMDCFIFHDEIDLEPCITKTKLVGLRLRQYLLEIS